MIRLAGMIAAFAIAACSSGEFPEAERRYEAARQAGAGNARLCALAREMVEAYYFDGRHGDDMPDAYYAARRNAEDWDHKRRSAERHCLKASLGIDDDTILDPAPAVIDDSL